MKDVETTQDQITSYKGDQVKDELEHAFIGLEEHEVIWFAKDNFICQMDRITFIIKFRTK